MMMKDILFLRFTAFILSVLLCFGLCSCAETSGGGGLVIDPNGQTITEDIIHEDIIKEDILKEDILSELKLEEVYLRELIVCENTITEKLLQEDRIEEVVLCQTLYIPQENIEEFSQNSQIATLFTEDINIKSVLTKVTIGTGVIVTLSVLKIAKIDGVVGSIVAAAAPEALQDALIGTGAGTLIGGLIGASEGFDESGRTAAVVSFSIATVGLILAAVSLVLAIPTGGTSTIGVATGVKIALAGIGLVGAAVGEGMTTSNMIKTFQSADEKDIDWNNIDWNKIGEGAVKRSIEGASNGYMWGSIVGAVKGGAEGLEYYQKYHTPYSTYNLRLSQTPTDDEYGHWTGERGESDYVYDKPKTIPISKDKTVTVERGTKVTYKNAVPDFSQFSKAKVSIINMTNDRQANFSQADKSLAEYWSKTKFNGHTWKASDVRQYRSDNQLTWHEMNDLKSMQLVPTEVNSGFGHLGGVGEYNALTNQQGGFDFG